MVNGGFEEDEEVSDLMRFLKGVELSLYRERIQESVVTSRPTCFCPTSQLRRQRSKIPKD